MNGLYLLLALLWNIIICATQPVIVPYERGRDFDAIQKILHEYKDKLMYESLGNPEGTTQAYLDSSKYLTYVLRVDDTTVGFINYAAFDANVLTFHMRRYGQIHLIGIDTQYQNKGYGSTLLKHAMEDLKRLQVSEIIIGVKRGNIRALTLYKKIGFISPPLELYKHLPQNIPLILTYNTGSPFDVSRGNIIQKHLRIFGTLFVANVIGYVCYKKWTKRA